MSKRHPNDLFDFMRSISREMAEDYERIRGRAPDDSAIAGGAAEDSWKELFEDWLSPSFPIVTKAQIMAPDGDSSPEIDLLVLSPNYPRKLRKSKQCLAGGVLAAFECKLTLEAADVGEAVNFAAGLARILPKRLGTPFRELHTPIITGLLAHSHSWKGPGSRPRENVERQLAQIDNAVVKHPREMLDLICVPDLAVWTALRHASLDPDDLKRRTHPDVRLPDRLVITAYARRDSQIEGQVAGFTPIGALISKLLVRLAWEDSSLRPLAEYFMEVNLDGTGQGGTRMWDVAGIFSEGVLKQAAGNAPPVALPPSGTQWDEWNPIYF